MIEPKISTPQLRPRCINKDAVAIKTDICHEFLLSVAADRPAAAGRNENLGADPGPRKKAAATRAVASNTSPVASLRTIRRLVAAVNPDGQHLFPSGALL
jgi:hypothetical protein